MDMLALYSVLKMIWFLIWFMCIPKIRSELRQFAGVLNLTIDLQVLAFKLKNITGQHENYVFLRIDTSQNRS